MSTPGDLVKDHRQVLEPDSHTAVPKMDNRATRPPTTSSPLPAPSSPPSPSPPSPSPSPQRTQSSSSSRASSPFLQLGGEPRSTVGQRWSTTSDSGQLERQHRPAPLSRPGSTSQDFVMDVSDLDSQRAPLQPGSGAAESLLLSATRANAPPMLSSPASYLEDLAPEDWARETCGQRVRYEDFTTIDWMHDFAKERLRLNRLRRRGGWLANVADSSQAWVLVALVGVLMGGMAGYVVLFEEWLFDLRTGYCGAHWFRNKRFCCPDDAEGEKCAEWHSWASSAPQGASAVILPALIYTALAVLYAGLSSITVKYLASNAAGSGIPEVKTILGGFIMRSFLGLRTLFVKAFTLPLATASGMSVGKEGPMVHLACCLGNILSRGFSKFAHNEAKKREVLSAAAAAGVSCAFGAPIAGVLFSLEELSYYFPYKTMMRAFFSAMVAAVTLHVLNPLRTGKLVLFQVKYTNNWHAFELFFFVIIGALGGIYGALFVKSNLFCNSLRKLSWLKVRPAQEACVIALVTACISYASCFLYLSSGALVYQLFTDCPAPELVPMSPVATSSEAAGQGSPQVQPDVVAFDPNVMRLCGITGNKLGTIAELLFSAIVKSVLTVLTFGARVPCGVFIPSMTVGACIGRAIGLAVSWAQASFPSFILFRACENQSSCINAGAYGLLGAAAFLGGVTRMTVSLVVIMFEITGALDYILPCMVTVMVAKFVGDAMMKDSIYDGLIRLNSYPYLDARHEYVQSIAVSEVMTSVDNVLLCYADNATVGSLDMLLRQTEFKGFPIVSGTHRPLLIGYISRAELRFALEHARLVYGSTDDTACYLGPTGEFTSPPALLPPPPDSGSLQNQSVRSGQMINLVPWIDQSPMTLVPRYPMEIAIELFKKMGLRYVIITSQGLVRGLITKKDILRHLGRVHSTRSLDQRTLIDRLVG